jgi:hypothetical protein
MALDTPKIPGDGPFRDDEAELQKLSVDLGGSPAFILFRQASVKTADLLSDLRPALATTRSPAPVRPKTGAMPSDDGFWFRNDEDVSPAGPDAAQGSPEESVQRVHCWPPSSAFEHGDLLSKGKDFEGGIASTAEEDADGSEYREDEFQHEPTLVTWRNVARTGRLPQTASC